MRFTKKPVTIEAWQNPRLNDVPEEKPAWLIQAYFDGGGVQDNPDGSINITTMEGVMRADPGDYIIRGVKGELYPCKPDIFAATYEVERKGYVFLTIENLVDKAHGTSLGKGWWDDERHGLELDRLLVRKTIPTKLCLIHSEVSEALEDYRDGNFATVLNEQGKPEGFASELADIIIRVADLAGALGIDLEQEITEKMKFNLTRPRRHGGKTC